MRRILTTAVCGALMAPGLPIATAYAQAPAQPPVLDIPLQDPNAGVPAAGYQGAPLPDATTGPALGDPAPTEVEPAVVDGSKKKKKKLVTKEKAGGAVGGIIGGLAGAAGGPLGKIAGSFVGRKIGSAVMGDGDKDKKAEEAEVLQAKAETPPATAAAPLPAQPPVTEVAASPEAPDAAVNVAATEPAPPPVLNLPVEMTTATAETAAEPLPPEAELAYETPPI